MSTGTPYFVVDRITGAILVTGTASPASFIPLQSTDTRLAIEGTADPDTQRWDIEAEVLIDRFPLSEPDQTTIPADGADTSTVMWTGLPEGATIRVQGPHTRLEGIVSSDGIATMSTDWPGTYTVTIEHPHYIRQEVKIVAT